MEQREHSPNTSPAIAEAFPLSATLEYKETLWSPPLDDRCEERSNRLIAVAAVSLLWIAGLVGELEPDGRTKISFLEIDLEGREFWITCVALGLLLYTFLMWQLAVIPCRREWKSKAARNYVLLRANATEFLGQLKKAGQAFEKGMEIKKAIADAKYALFQKSADATREFAKLQAADEEFETTDAQLAAMEVARRERDYYDRKIDQLDALYEMPPDALTMLQRSGADQSGARLEQIQLQFSRFQRVQMFFEVWAVGAVAVVAFVLLAAKLYAYWPTT